MTTFPSFPFEPVRLWETGDRTSAVATAVENLLVPALALGLAWSLVGST